MFLTVYPRGLDLQDRDVSDLVNQLDQLTNPVNGSSRRVMLRFAPEMNGNWFNNWSMRPTAWKAAYIKIVTAVRRRTSRVAFVWSPNVANNYPFGGTIDGAEISALDTNGDGIIDNSDDPFTPYWPGPEFVDWVGISLYWKGPYGMGFPAITNAAPPLTLFEEMIQGSVNERVNPNFPFYTMFCERFNKPLVLSEGGAAFHESYSKDGVITPVDPGPGRLDIQQAFWRSFITNSDFLNRYPKAKMFVMFEHYKSLEDGRNGNLGVNRDYRITVDPDMLAAFKADLDGVSGRYAWAMEFKAGLDPLFLTPGKGWPTFTTAIAATPTKTMVAENATATQSVEAKANGAICIAPFKYLLFAGVLFALLFLQ
ncbi:hypothetical protein HDU97_007028 [Phlyctochytrium planicorne]|nr:hypothetical protein HDU97_007028 [Phlyctochytrium planicorne]